MTFVWSSIVLLMMFPKIASSAVENGIIFTYLNIIPTLFPFLIVSKVFVLYADKLKIPRSVKLLFQKLFCLSENSVIPFMIGIISGFPVGAKATADLYSDEKISKDEAEHIIPLVNNPNFAFVIFVVGLNVLKDIHKGFLLYFSIIAAFLTTAIILSPTKKIFKAVQTPKKSERLRFGAVLVNAIQNATLTMVYLTGYICSFFVFNQIILSMLPANNIFAVFITSLLELAKGSAQVSQLFIPDILKLPLISFVLGFGGICVYFQAYAMLIDTDLRPLNYIKIKFLNAFICALYTFLMFTLHSYAVVAIFAVMLLFIIIKYFSKNTNFKLKVD